MWPALIFVLLVVVVIADSLWKERRLRQARLLAKQEYTARLLEQQQQDYQHAQAQQRALFDNMAEGVVLLDERGRIQLVNQALRRLFGLATEINPGVTLLEAFRLPPLADLAEQLARQRAILQLELELPATPPRYLELNASAVSDKSGAYRGGILVFHDLTRMKQLENARKDFVANVSHELRTPLSLIKGFVETLLEGARDDPELTVRYLSTVKKQTDRLTYLIEDLLSIAQLESGQVVLNQKQVCLRPIAEHVLDDLRSKATEKQTQLRNELPDALSVWADAERLEQVLFNLVENAIKYGRVNGHILIQAQPAGGNSVEVSVQDDGPGIPLEAQSRIFERFFRVDRARSRETGGTGLGLAIVKHIVLAHGGSVWVKSLPGQGASFHFVLPQSGASTATGHSTS